MNPTATSSKKILVVDDDQVILSAVSGVLKSGGHQTATARDGSETFMSIRHEKPDLIFLDLAFPPDPANVNALQDGFFIMEWLKHTPGAEKIPVVIISSTEPAKYKARAEAAGVAAYLQKPLQRSDILQTVENVLVRPRAN